MHEFSKNIGTTTKLYTSEWRHETRSIKRQHKIRHHRTKFSRHGDLEWTKCERNKEHKLLKNDTDLIYT